MQESTLENLNLYLLRTVVATFTDGRSVSGELKHISSVSSEITIDSSAYPISDLTDLEMTGTITYHTYAVDRSKSCEMKDLYFGLDDFVPDTDHSKLLFDEFRCIGACHLVFEEGKIHAKDVRILSCSHKIFTPVLTKTPYLYLFHDSSIVVGTLSDTTDPLSVQTADGPIVPLEPSAVRDIIRLPLTNEFIEVTRKDGTVISGTVSAANDFMIVLIGESVQRVQLVSVLSIRYRGTILLGTAKLASGTVKQVKLSLGVKDEAFLCKLPYFRSHDDEVLAVDGATASFIPGISGRGPIAKDVTVEANHAVESEAEPETGIIVIAPAGGRTTGYIGKEFASKTYALFTHSSLPRGSVSFSVDQLSFRITPRYIHIVKYRCIQHGDALLARNIELIETYPLADYAKIWIDDAGKVRRLPVSVLFPDKFIDHAADVETTGGQWVSGVISEASDTEILLSAPTEKISVQTADILRVFYYGTVTAYQSNNGTGFINGQYWFHVNNFADMDQIRHLSIGTSVRFTFEVSTKGNLCAATSIEIVEGSEKRGYVLKYVADNPRYPGKKFGFITKPELLEDCLKRNDRSGTYYFNGADIQNSNAFKIDTGRNYYLVTFTEGENKTAHNVRFLEEHAYTEGAAPTHAVPPQASEEINGAPE